MRYHDRVMDRRRAMKTQAREKFATQVKSEILSALRSLAKSEGRQLQALVDEALADLLEKRRLGRPRAHVMAAKAGCGRTTWRKGYALSQRVRKRIEEIFGWAKTVGPVAKTMLRGVERVGAQFTFTLAAYNLARLPKLLAA
jgi:hypothetical protein